MPGGPGPFGRPEEPDGTGDDEPAAGGTPGGPGDPSGGWVPPSSRPWRHPSEFGSPTGARGIGDAMGRRGRAADGRKEPSNAASLAAAAARRPASHRVASVGVVGVAVVAVVVGSFLLLRTSEGPGTPQSTVTSAVQQPITAVAGCCHITAAAVRRAEEGLVAIEQPGGTGVLLGCGVVVAGAGLVATTADVVAGHRTLRAVTADGRQLRATVMAVDRASDLALLSVPASLSVARFAGDADVGPGFPTTTVVMPTGHAQAASGKQWWAATVRSVGAAVQRGAATGMAAIMVTGKSLPDVPGQPLLDADGEVIGVLDQSGTPSDGVQPYLPSSLVVGVAQELATSGKVDHGWLDAQVGQVPAASSTSTGSAPTTSLHSDTASSGARVVAVEPDGASSRILEPGDVIVAVDGQPVRSMAELRTRLYVLPPGSRATVTAMRAGHSITEVVELAPSP